jgi:Cu/Ag efflux pump CusA
MNSKTAQLTENGTEIVRLFARFALGASFLSAVADRFGLWGPHGAKNVSWGDFAHFVEYAGRWALRYIPLDALPDISDVEVIIHTPWAGQPPSIIEDQVTYPIVTTLLAAPHAKAVRAQTMFGDSYVFVVFEDATDLYWARSRVLEYMQQITGRLPSGVHPVIEALNRRIATGNPRKHEDIEAAVIAGAVQRLRPKLMTVCVVLASLIPILWETGVDSDVMKPIAAPIVGGMITSTIHVLILVPVFSL